MSEVEQAGSPEGVEDGGQRAAPSRVVLRGMTAIVLDDLPEAQRAKVLEAVGTVSPVPPMREVWVAVAARTGTPDAAITSYAGKSGTTGCKPGQYKAVPLSSWFVPPLGIEPALPAGEPPLG